MSKEKFLIDSNSFVEAKNRYYAFDIAPGFWKQLTSRFKSGEIVILDVVKDELLKGDDELSVWFKELDPQIKDHREQAILKKYGEVLEFVKNAPHYKEAALQEWSRPTVADPWLIATAAVYGYTIITLEKSAMPNTNSPSGKPKIPDVASEFDVKTDDLFFFLRQSGVVLN